MSTYWGFSITVACKNCGKKFYIADRNAWAYKISDGTSRKYFCSWSCLRQYEKKKEEERFKGRTYVPRKRRMR